MGTGIIPDQPLKSIVAFDGQDLCGLDTAAVRMQIGVVLQSGRITAGSILENISVGAHITMNEAWEAIEDAGLAEDIHSMPMGLHTVVSDPSVAESFFAVVSAA